MAAKEKKFAWRLKKSLHRKAVPTHYIGDVVYQELQIKSAHKKAESRYAFFTSMGEASQLPWSLEKALKSMLKRAKPYMTQEQLGVYNEAI